MQSPQDKARKEKRQVTSLSIPEREEALPRPSPAPRFPRLVPHDVSTLYLTYPRYST